MIWLLVPFLLKSSEWGKGLKWEAHIIFAIYMIISFASEFTIFRVLFKEKTRKSLFKEENSAWFTYFTMCFYWLTGLIGKGDIYTDISFIVEMGKCSEQSSDKFKLAILIVASIVFILTIAYQFFVFIMLIFKSSNQTFCPLTSHLTRILLWGENKMLAMILNKYSIRRCLVPPKRPTLPQIREGD